MKPLNKQLLIAATSTLLILPAFGQNKASNVMDLKYSIEDDNIVYPESFNLDSQKLLERWYLKNYTTTDQKGTTDHDPGATEKQIKDRLAALPTVIDMPYNSIVKQYIEKYTKKGRRQVTALLGLSSYYMPIFEQALEEAGLPLELKYLPVIESALDPNATSKSGAAGLWQFVLVAARGYDMEVNSLIDERRDPYISSERACRMLKDLYNTYGDWSLAIAAYNCGPGTVNKALARAGGDRSSHDFWSIYNYLPSETRGYVPAFIAANYVMTYYPEHNIYPVLATKPLVTDTIHLVQRVHFNQISAVLDIPVDELRVLNPQFRADIIPASDARPCNLILPSQQVHAYLVSEDQILDYERDLYARRIEATPGGDPDAVAEPYNPADQAVVEAAATELVYEELNPVETDSQPTAPRRRRSDNQAANTRNRTEGNGTASGSTASATQKPASATQTKPANTSTQASTTTRKKPQATTASTSGSSKKPTQTASAQKKKAATTAKPKEHNVSSGENLTVIAKKHGVTVEQLKKANPKLKNDMIHPGDKIVVPSQQKTSTKKKKK